jgi:MoaA/NifB/PqqE/SkfB family radical SAM enzyme
LEGQLLINTYCDRPWTELHIEEDGSVTPCCVMPSNRFPMGDSLKEYITGKPLKELKASLQAGIQHKNCEWCWNNEKNNLKTHRITESRGSGLNSIHIRLNNVCNFSCRMCGPAFSSTWAQENKKHKWYQYEEDNQVIKDSISQNGDVLFDLLQKNITNGSLKHLSISGGEPLITEAHHKLLSFLIDNNLTNITLGYSTNLSNLDYKGIDLLSLWEKFDSVNLEVSIDGWGDSVEYSRTGFKTIVFLENFKRALKYIHTINCVVNIYSVWTLPQIEKFKKFGINIVYSPCYLPLHCNPQLLMQEDKLELQRLYSSHSDLQNLYINFISKDVEFGFTPSEKESDFLEKQEHLTIDEMRIRMVDYNLLLDSYRGTDFFSTFPVYKKYQNIHTNSNWVPWYIFNKKDRQ